MAKQLLLLLLLLPILSIGQKSNFGNWYNYFGNKLLNNNFNWHHEVQFRNYNAIGDLEQLLIRTGLGYNLSESNNNLLLGYGFIKSENYINDSEIKENLNEHRIFQQFITRQNFGRVSFQHRYRFEQRILEEEFKLRFRYFLSTNIALSNKTLIDNTIYLTAYNEIFINTKEILFDRNRLYGGLGYKLDSNLSFEVGYMNQFLGNINRDQLNLMLFLTL